MISINLLNLLIRSIEKMVAQILISWHGILVLNPAILFTYTIGPMTSRRVNRKQDRKHATTWQRRKSCCNQFSQHITFTPFHFNLIFQNQKKMSLTCIFSSGNVYLLHSGYFMYLQNAKLRDTMNVSDRSNIRLFVTVISDPSTPEMSSWTSLRRPLRNLGPFK